MWEAASDRKPAGNPQPHLRDGPDAASGIRPETEVMQSSLIDARDVVLRDGSTLRLRPPDVDDAEALLEFFSGLSEQASTGASMVFHLFGHNSWSRSSTPTGMTRAH